MNNFTIIIPFWNGNGKLTRLLDSIPTHIPVIIVQDYGSEEPIFEHHNVVVLKLSERGYFSGACNAGIKACETDVIILNQDVWFYNTDWLRFVKDNKANFAMFGDGVFGHKAWPAGYVQGTFMYISRKAWEKVGMFNTTNYPLWGSTCEWQLRACRLGFKVLPINNVPGMSHEPRGRGKFGNAVTQAIKNEPGKRFLFTDTPPMISVIIPCYNYGQYLVECINSLLGGQTSLGMAKPQTFQSFEIIIVNDASTDDTDVIAKTLADSWKGIRYIKLKNNVGTASALNEGIKRANGHYIHILSADDLRKEYTLENFVKAALKNPKSFIYGDTTTFGYGKIVKHLMMGKYDFNQLLRRNNVPAGIMFPKQAWIDVGGYPIEFNDGREDWAFAVALGARGWCGHYIGDKSGNLYRKEKQGRSYINWKKKLKGYAYYRAKMQNRYPALYQGDLPMGCCGSNSKTNKKTGKKSSVKVINLNPRSIPVNVDGMVELRYVGRNTGTETWRGSATGKTYKFGLNARRQNGWVDKRDVEMLLRSKQFEVIKKRRARNLPVVEEIKKPEAIEITNEIIEEKVTEPTIEIIEPDEVEIDATTGAVKFAKTLDIDLLEIEKEGRINKRDVEDYARKTGLL